ncbi:hypothetical protein [Streptomyces macrolidinus]|nr:hypothetical protein [Streptomyces macrolidinus]
MTRARATTRPQTTESTFRAAPAPGEQTAPGHRAGGENTKETQ